MKAIEQYFHVVLFIMLYKVVLTSKSVDETPVCDHSYESYRVVLSCGTVSCVVLYKRYVPLFSGMWTVLEVKSLHEKCCDMKLNMH